MEEKIKQLIERVTREAAARHPKTFDGVYREEPILYTADRMQGYTPPRIGEMRRLAAKADWRVSEAELFCRQGEFMADYEEDYAFTGTFSRYFPTYQAMNNAQLRGYFAWRTRRRRGDAEMPPLSFAFLYAYELINQIGVADPLQGYEALAALRRDLGRGEPALDAHLAPWMEDYVIYYRLDPALLTDTPRVRWDRALLTACQPEGREPEEVFAALCALSTYNAAEGWAGREHGDELAAVTCRVTQALAAYCAAHREQSLWDRLLGAPADSVWVPFRSAVFFDRCREPGEFRISGNRRMLWRQSVRHIESLHSLQGKSADIGRLLKAVDSRMREACGWDHPIRCDAPKYVTALIDKAVAAWQAEQAAAAARRVDIDFGKLAAIRQAAAITRDRLLAEEPPEAPPPPPAPPPPEVGGLTPAGTLLLKSLLYESAPRVPAGQMLSVVAEEVNEALYDRFADTVILFEGEAPVLAEDYIEDLKGLILP